MSFVYRAITFFGRPFQGRSTRQITFYELAKINLGISTLQPPAAPRYARCGMLCQSTNSMPISKLLIFAIRIIRIRFADWHNISTEHSEVRLGLGFSLFARHY